MKQLINDNAANRSSFVGEVYNFGAKQKKIESLNQLSIEERNLHIDGYIHIHDLDAFGLTYNCLTFDILRNFPYEEFGQASGIRKITYLFGYLKTLFADMGNEQSGGMALANFDDDLATILEKIGFEDSSSNRELLASNIADLIVWCNNTHTRMGQTSYYVTFNIGLAHTDLAKFIAFTLIDEFQKLGPTIYKPNIVFKVAKGVNRFSEDRNFDLFSKALLCTAQKMIPTYLLCDCEGDKHVCPEKLSVMGCRTRVVDDIYGYEGAIGRGNICCASINLPRLAIEIDKSHKNESTLQKYDLFLKKWKEVAKITSEILLKRYSATCNRNANDFPTNSNRQMWCVPFQDPKEVFKHGTISLGYIGLSEAMEVLTGTRFYEDMVTYDMAISFVKIMRKECDEMRSRYNLNFSLLASSGEYISGRFIEIDKKLFTPTIDIFSKGFYTNSFHINVDSGIPARKKIELEGPFHILSNGGSISYIELNEAPIGNDEGLRELVEIAISSGVHYLGINFPKDICKDCGYTGIFDDCPSCGSSNITRIRRVSGYLELLDGFTNGKKNEVRSRKNN